MRRILQHAVIGVSVSALAGAAVVGTFGHGDAVAGAGPVVVTSAVPAPASTAASATASATAQNAALTLVDQAFATTRSGITRPATTAATNVANDSRRTALATQAELVSAQRLAILQQRQVAADQKRAAAYAKAEAAETKLLKAEVAAAAKAQVAAQQQQQADEAAQAAAAAARAAAPTDNGTTSGTTSGTATGVGSTGGTTTSTGGDPRAIARQLMLSRYGWGADQFSCLNTIYVAESNWRVSASNPSSGAYGIPQSLPGSKMAAAGSDWRTNPTTQISWGLSYIKARYGTPCGALSFRKGHGYY